MSTRKLARVLPKLLVVAGGLLWTSTAYAGTCYDGSIFCTAYGYRCDPGGCPPISTYCCMYACDTTRPGTN
jgi:hypothetical protein